MLAALALALVEVARHQLLVELAGIVVQFPVPVVRIPRQCRQGDEHGADLERAAILRLLGLLALGFSPADREQRGCGAAEQCASESLHVFPPSFGPPASSRLMRPAGSRRSGRSVTHLLLQLLVDPHAGVDRAGTDRARAKLAGVV